MSPRSLLGLFFRASLLAGFLCFPLFAEQFRSDGFSPKLFSDWDEPFYFTLAYRMGELSSVQIAERMPWIPAAESERLRMEVPSSLLDVFIGKFGLNFGFKPVELGLLLDFLCFVLSYVGFTCFFRALSGDSWGGELGAATLLLVPWLLYQPSFCDLPIHFEAFGVNVASRACHVWPSLPVWRGFYTQLSYPLLAGGLYMLVSARSRRVLSGILLGALIYVYVFAWVSAIFVAGLYLCVEQTKKRIGNLVRFVLSAALISAPGLFWFLCGHSPVRDSLMLPEDFPKFIRFSPVILMMLVLCALLRKKFQLSEKGKVLDFLLCLLLAEAILPNYQVFSRGLWLDDHFSVFFLEPLLSGLVGVFIFGLLSMQVTKTAFILVLTLLAAREQRRISDFRDRYSDRKADLEELSIAVMKYTRPHERLFYLSPNAANYELPPEVEALTRRRVDAPVFLTTLYESGEEGVKNELFVSWFLRGKLQLFNECPGIYDHSGLRWSVHNWITYRRNIACKKAEGMAESFDPCAMLGTLKDSFIVWEFPSLDSLPSEKQKIVRLVYMTRGRIFGLFRITEEISLCEQESSSEASALRSDSVQRNLDASENRTQ